jgi:hypothetical protein
MDPERRLLYKYSSPVVEDRRVEGEWQCNAVSRKTKLDGHLRRTNKELSKESDRVPVNWLLSRYRISVGHTTYKVSKWFACEA